MTLREKVGQLLMVGFRGLEVGEHSPIVRAIAAGLVGGVVLFDQDMLLKGEPRNIQSPRQVRKLISSLQQAAAVPLLVAVDQEGGQVARLKKKYGFPATVSARYLGDVDDTELTGRHAAATAAVLARAGFNLNFAPVVDLNVNPSNPVIGKLDRSYSPKVPTVVRHALAVIEAHRRQGVGCCLKHFPGHGSSRGDSHLGFTDVSDTWEAPELEPYAEIIARGRADAVMTAHIFNRRLDPGLPATLSQRTIAGLLRRELGFTGVVISDDLDMKAISAEYERDTALALALNAGNDIILIANNLAYDDHVAARAHDSILRLVDAGLVSQARIDEACRRVMDLKHGRIALAAG
ncbi:MAG TPA: glycoside hydrolase family 3 N-terminal domain-containing protein [Acidobacteriota bacterium]